MVPHRDLQLFGRRKHLKRSFDEAFTKENQKDLFDVPSDTKAALNHILSLFPRDKFANKLPAIGLKHQIYNLVQDKTIVDRELNALRDRGEIRYFKLDSGNDEFAVVYDKDYMDLIRACVNTRGLQDNPGVNTFLEQVLPSIKDVSIEKKIILKDFRLSDQVITNLMSIGILNIRDERSLWISIPGNAPYMKSLLAGRKAVLSMVNKRKYKEIFERELGQRDISLHSRLGIQYHIHDIVGGDMVKKIETTNGTLLRSVQTLRKQRSKVKR